MTAGTTHPSHSGVRSTTRTVEPSCEVLHGSRPVELPHVLQTWR